MSDKEAELKKIREKALADTEKVAPKARFGLFSSPPPLSIGDDSYDRKKLHPKDDQGKPITEPKNITIKASQMGKSSKSSYFSILGFATIGDKYVDPERLIRQQELEKSKLIKSEYKFKPASGYQTMLGSTYKHDSEFIEKKVNHRDADGRVILQNKNVTTNPAAKNLFKFRPHMVEPYDNLREQKKTERLEHYKKVGERAAFKLNNPGGKNFVSDKETFNSTGKLPPEKPKIEPNLKIMQHEAPFKPSSPAKKGQQGFLGKFPPYKGDPIKVTQRIDPKKGDPVFKSMHGKDQGRPTPSVSCHPINIRKEIMSSSSTPKL